MWRHRTLIEFQCGVCKKVDHGFEPLSQCAVCARFLCPDCDTNGLCPSDYRFLKEADQNMLFIFAEKEDAINSRFRVLYFFMLLLAPMAIGFILGAILIAFMDWSRGYPTDFSISVLIVGMILLGGLLAVIYYRSQLGTQREVIKITVDGILMKYPALAVIMQRRSGMRDQEELDENSESGMLDR